MRLALCDDDENELKQTGQMLSSYLAAHPDLDGCLACFHSPYDLNEHVSAQGGFHAYFLDVMMPGMDGIQLGGCIRAAGDKAPIIYLTSSPDFDMASYSVRAYGYLLKPVQRSALETLLDELTALWRDETQRPLPVRTTTGITPVYPGDLMYMEVRGHAFLYHLAGGQTVKSVANQGTLDTAAAPLLASPRFVKINRGQVVNMSYISSLSGNDFLMPDGAALRISRLLAAQVKNRYIDYILDRGRQS